MVQVTTTESTNTAVVENETASGVCRKCGAPIEADVAFCTECGSKL